MFTGTINTSCEFFITINSFDINIKNYEDISIDSVTNYRCNGWVLSFQPKTYTYTINNYKYVNKIKVFFRNSYSDDFGRMIVNGVKIADLPGFSSSSTTRIIEDFKMESPTLTVQIGAVNTKTEECYFYGNFSITVYYE